MRRAKVQPPPCGNLVQASPACWTRFCCLHQFSTLNFQSSMLDFLWGAQDRDRVHDPRDFSRRPHSPLIALLRKDSLRPA